MEANQSARPTTLAGLLAELRRQKGFTKQGLAEASEVSATYIGQIESSIDPRTGKPYQPSPPKLRMLARALGGEDALEVDRVYRLLMEAAGYLPGDPRALEATPEAPPRLVRAAETRATFQVPELRAPAQAERPLPQTAPPAPPPRWTGGHAPLLDPRLEAHIHPLLEHWDELTSGEQSALLEFAEYIDQKRRRRQGEAGGGH